MDRETMTLEEFLTKFEEVAPQFTWRKNIMGQIRGTYKNDLGFCGCPITCMLYSQNPSQENILPSCLFYKASERIGMEKQHAENIATSADFPCQILMKNDYKKTRTKLLQICGLKED